METWNAILTRRSVRKYTGEKMPEETLNAILKAGLLSPSSRNFKSAEFIVVGCQEQLAALAGAKAGGNMMLKASHAIVVIGDSARSDAWIEDGSIAMTQMMLRATDLGIGSCWIHVRNRNTADGSETSESYIRKMMNIPENYSVLAILSLGIPEGEVPGHTEDEADCTKVHVGTF